ncbi:MAG: AAA family ATPase [Chloroflexota bacterium]|nr:AAA family ATPase [Chloroflexota bacterium]
MPSNSILICAPPGDGRDALQRALRDAGHNVAVVDDAAPAISLVRDGTVDVIVADGLTVSAAVESLRSASPSRPTPIVVVAPGDDVEARIAFLEAGADDVLGQGFEPQELQARVEALLIRHRQIMPPTSAPAPSTGGAQLTAVFSAKGGAGVTTLAVNLALALRAATSERVLLIDLDLQFGQVATHLNLVPAFDLGALVADEAAMREVDVAMSFLTAHDSGISVLASPSSPDVEARITVDDTAAIVSLFRPRFDRIVVDCGERFDQRTMHVLESADTHVAVVVPELAALKAMSALLSYLGDTGTRRGRSLLVVNRIFPKELLKTSDVAELLQVRVAAEIPYTEIHMIRAINEGSPIVTSRASSPPAAAIRGIAQMITSPEPAATQAAPRRGLFRRG